MKTGLKNNQKFCRMCRISKTERQEEMNVKQTLFTAMNVKKSDHSSDISEEMQK